MASLRSLKNPLTPCWEQAVGGKGGSEALIGGSAAVQVGADGGPGHVAAVAWWQWWHWGLLWKQS